MASSFSSIANHDDFSAGDAQSDLQTLTKLYGLLDSSNDLNTPGTGEKILGEKSRILLRKMLDKHRAKIFPMIPGIENPIKEENQHGLNSNPKIINYSPVPNSFQRKNPNLSNSQFSSKSRQSQPVDQSCIGNRSTSRSVITPHRPIIKSNYPINYLKSQSNMKPFVYKRTNYNNIKGNYKYNIKRPDLKEDIKGKSKEVFSNSNSSYDSYSSTSCDSVPSKPKSFAKRPGDYKKFAKCPSPSRHSKSPSKDNKPVFKKLPNHHNNNKASNKIPSHNNNTNNNNTNNNINNNNNNKALIKMRNNNNNKALIKMPSHNNKVLKESTKRKDEKTFKEENEKKESGFKKMKNKLAVIFHHHHHHHLHHGDNSSNNKNKNNKIIKKHHRSAWKFLKGMLHKSSEHAVEIAPHQHHQHKHLRELFHVLVSHLWSNKGKIGRVKNNNKRKKLHWWQKFKKRGGVKLTNGKRTRVRLL